MVIDVPFEPRPTSDAICVLVVEDEFLIRTMVSDALRDAGLGVIEAIDADEAMRVLQSGVAIDLIFSDVRMPGSMDGLALLKICTEVFPGLPVIITSGHLAPSDAILNGAKRFLPKPYLWEDAIVAIRLELGLRE